MSDFTLILGSTNAVELTDFVDQTTGQRPTTAVVTVTVKDANGSPVAGATAIAMPYDARRRSYRGLLPAAVAWTAGAVYTEVITATVGTNVRVFERTGTAAAG